MDVSDMRILPTELQKDIGRIILREGCYMLTLMRVSSPPQAVLSRSAGNNCAVKIIASDKQKLCLLGLLYFLTASALSWAPVDPSSLR